MERNAVKTRMKLSESTIRFFRYRHRDRVVSTASSLELLNTVSEASSGCVSVLSRLSCARRAACAAAPVEPSEIDGKLGGQELSWLSPSSPIVPIRPNLVEGNSRSRLQVGVGAK